MKKLVLFFTIGIISFSSCSSDKESMEQTKESVAQPAVLQEPPAPPVFVLTTKLDSIMAAILDTISVRNPSKNIAELSRLHRSDSSFNFFSSFSRRVSTTTGDWNEYNDKFYYIEQVSTPRRIIDTVEYEIDREMGEWGTRINKYYLKKGDIIVFDKYGDVLFHSPVRTSAERKAFIQFFAEGLDFYYSDYGTYEFKGIFPYSLDEKKKIQMHNEALDREAAYRAYWGYDEDQ